MSPSRHKERPLTSTKVRELKGQEVMFMSEGFDEILADSSPRVRNLATRTRALIRDVSRTWLRSCGQDRESWATASGRGRCRNTSLHRLPQDPREPQFQLRQRTVRPGPLLSELQTEPSCVSARLRAVIRQMRVERPTSPGRLPDHVTLLKLTQMVVGRLRLLSPAADATSRTLGGLPSSGATQVACQEICLILETIRRLSQ
jgi:hypothetical protein